MFPNLPKETYVAIDLDGTLIEDAVYPIIFKNLFFSNPIRTSVSVLAYIVLGPNIFTARHVERNLHFLGLDSIETSKLKFNKILIDFLKELQSQKKILILATGSDQCVADLIGDYIEKNFGVKFDMLIGSEPGFLCISENKLAKLREISTEFAYIGNSNQDFPVWRAKGVNMICVGDEAFQSMAQERCCKPALLTIPPIFEYMCDIKPQ